MVSGEGNRKQRDTTKDGKKKKKRRFTIRTGNGRRRLRAWRATFVTTRAHRYVSVNVVLISKMIPRRRDRDVPRSVSPPGS